MATYECPRQRSVSIGEQLEGYGVVLGADDIPAELRLDGTMSITNELRKWLEHAYSFSKGEDIVKTPNPWFGWKPNLERMLDRIDEAHERELVEVRAEGIAEGIDADFEAREHHGWARLPVDADGVPWYRGSKVIDPQDPEGNVCTVWIAGDNTLITDDHLFIYDANKLRHYHAPTTEDVLCEMLETAVGYSDAHTTVALNAIAEYAKRLQLREDA